MIEYDEYMTNLERVANEHFGGHVTIMKFTTNWRVWFGTPSDRGDIQAAPVGKTFQAAAEKALATDPAYFRTGSSRCEFCGVTLHPADNYACDQCRKSLLK
jgi:secreted PhoX family phosphatase